MADSPLVVELEKKINSLIQQVNELKHAVSLLERENRRRRNDIVQLSRSIKQ